MLSEGTLVVSQLICRGRQLLATRGFNGDCSFSSQCVLTCSVPAAPSSPSSQTLAGRKDTA